MDRCAGSEGDEMKYQDGSFRTGYVPITPGGTFCFWLASKTEDEAWENLLRDAAHMPYRSKRSFMRRGYTVELVQAAKGTK